MLGIALNVTAQNMGLAGQLNCLFNCFDMGIKHLAFQAQRELRS